MHATPSCETVKVFPAAVIVPVRDVELMLVATSNAIVPEPLPLAPLVIVSQAALLVAVQLQASSALMPTVPVPPDAGTDITEALRCGEQNDENEKRFDASLAAVPPGPTAETRAS